MEIPPFGFKLRAHAQKPAVSLPSGAKPPFALANRGSRIALFPARGSALLLALLCLGSWPPATHAQTTWTNTNGTATWSDNLNWSAGEPTSGVAVTLPTPIPSGSSTITLSAGEIGGTLTINDSYTLSGGNLTLSGGTITVASTMTGSLNTVLAGSAGLTKSGAGTLSLQQSNTYSGATLISAGTLTLQNGGALGSTSQGTTIGTNAVLRLVGGITVAGEALVLNGVGANPQLVNGSGTNTWTGNISTNNAGIVRIGSSSGRLILSGNVALSTDASHQFVLQGDGAGEISGIISGAGRLTRSATGNGVWTLSGANTYTGQTVISNGTFSVSSLNRVVGGTASSGLGAPTTVASGTIDLGSGSSTGTLIYTGAGEITDRVLHLAGGTGGGRITQSGTGTLQFTSNLSAISGTKTFTLAGSTAGTGWFSGNITNGSGTVSLNKTGTGTWRLSGTNTYSGATTVDGGLLVVDGSLANTQVAVNGLGALGGVGTITTSNKTFTIASGGKISPGFGAASMGALTLNAGTSSINLSAAVSGTNVGALIFDLGAVGASDSIFLSGGTLDAGSGVLGFTDFDFIMRPGFDIGTYTLMSGYIGSIMLDGADLSGDMGGGYTGSLQSNLGQLNLVVVPEPSALLLMVLAGAAGLTVRHRPARKSLG